MNVLVDTPIWSLALRRRAKDLNPQERIWAENLGELILEGRVVMIGPVRQELLSGIRDEAQFRRLREHLRAFEDEPLSTEDYEEAAQIHNRCRAEGIAGSAVDFLICAAALRRKWQIFTPDEDFRRYASHITFSLYQPRPRRVAP